MTVLSVTVDGSGDGRAAIEAALADAGLPPASAPEAATVLLLFGDADAVQAALAAHPQRSVVVIADDLDRRGATTVLGAGARGIVGATCTGSELAAALNAVVAGFTVVSRSNLAAVAHPVLTARQQQIVSLLVLGLNNVTIAERLFVTESTVKTHLTTIFNKLGVKSRKEAIDLVLDPSSGLGPGILGMRAEAGAGGSDVYEPPTVRS